MAFSNLADWKEDTVSSSCGSACGTSDKPDEKPSACGSECGVSDK